MLYLTGIHNERQLARFDALSWLGRRRRIAIDLIDDIDRLGDPAARAALFERIVDARGAFKRTYLDRFAAFDARLIEIWRASLIAARPLRILDAAVSDGSTSLPLIRAFRDIVGPDLAFTATDLDGRYVKLWRPSRPDRRVILSERGEIVQIVLPPFLFTHRESRHLFPLNRALRPRAEQWARALVEDWRQDNGGEQGAVCQAEILLLAPEFKRLVDADSAIAFRSWDILEPWPGETAHVVRAMNVLNPGYFDAVQMRRVLHHLFDAVEDGGLLAMGSNENAGTAVDGVICRRRGDRLDVLATLGAGFRAPDALAPLLAAA